MKKIICLLVILVATATVMYLLLLPPSYQTVLKISEQSNNFLNMSIDEVLQKLKRHDAISIVPSDMRFSALMLELENSTTVKVDTIYYLQWNESRYGGYYAIYTVEEVVCGFDAAILWD